MTAVQESYTIAGVEAAHGITLTTRDKMLVQLRDELYRGSWSRMTADLNDRYKSRPFVYKIHDPIAQDLDRIPELKFLEDRTEENLAIVIATIEIAGETLPKPAKKVLSRV